MLSFAVTFLAGATAGAWVNSLTNGSLVAHAVATVALGRLTPLARANSPSEGNPIRPIAGLFDLGEDAARVAHC